MNQVKYCSFYGSMRKSIFPPTTATQQWSIGPLVSKQKQKNIVDHQIEMKTKLFIKYQTNLNWVDEKFFPLDIDKLYQL